MGNNIAQIAPNKSPDKKVEWAGEMLEQINIQVKKVEYLPHRLTPAISDLVSLVKTNKLELINYYATVEGDDLRVLFITRDEDQKIRKHLSRILAELYLKYDDESFSFEFLVFEQSDGIIPPSHFKELPKDNA